MSSTKSPYFIEKIFTLFLFSIDNKISSLAKMMDYEIKINKINDGTEMFDEKKAYYWLEKLNYVKMM